MTLAHSAPITAPTGTTLSCKGWHQEAALRMLMNNLDPAVAERPEDLIVYGGGGKAARNWDVLRAHRRDPAPARERRDPAGPERQAGRRVPHPRRGAAGADRERPPGAPLGHLGRVPAARGAGAHHVRADDRRVLDLHRHPGDPAGHLRDVRRVRAPALRRHAGGTAGGDRRPGRHGRRPAARRDDERRGVPRRRRRRVADPAAGGDQVLRPAGARSRRRAATGGGGARRAAAALGRPGRQHRRGAAGAGPARRRARRAHRSDLGARSASRLHPGRPVAGRGGSRARTRSGRVRSPGARFDGGPRGRHARAAGRGAR